MLTADTNWKKWERAVATDFGGTRTGPRGYGLPDVKGIPLAIEAKLQGRLSLKKSDLEQARLNAERQGKPWILALKEKGSRNRQRLIVCDYEWFRDEVYPHLCDSST